MSPAVYAVIALAAFSGLVYCVRDVRALGRRHAAEWRRFDRLEVL